MCPGWPQQWVVLVSLAVRPAAATNCIAERGKLPLRAASCHPPHRLFSRDIMQQDILNMGRAAPMGAPVGCINSVGLLVTKRLDVHPRSDACAGVNVVSLPIAPPGRGPLVIKLSASPQGTSRLPAASRTRCRFAAVC